MIFNLNQSNYEDNNGIKYNDTNNRELTAALLNNYFGEYNCSITICDRYSNDDLIVQYRDKTYHVDVKSCNIKSDTSMKIGYNLYQYDNTPASEEKRIIMIYSDAICIYNIHQPNWIYNTFDLKVNDQAHGKMRKNMVQLNNNTPTVTIPYYVPQLNDYIPS